MKKIIENNYNLTPSSLGLIEAEKTEHDEPEEILEAVVEREERILSLIAEMRELLQQQPATSQDG